LKLFDDNNILSDDTTSTVISNSQNSFNSIGGIKRKLNNNNINGGNYNGRSPRNKRRKLSHNNTNKSNHIDLTMNMNTNPYSNSDSVLSNNNNYIHNNSITDNNQINGHNIEPKSSNNDILFDKLYDEDIGSSGMNSSTNDNDDISSRKDDDYILYPEEKTDNNDDNNSIINGNIKQISKEFLQYNNDTILVGDFVKITRRGRQDCFGKIEKFFIEKNNKNGVLTKKFTATIYKSAKDCRFDSSNHNKRYKYGKQELFQIENSSKTYHISRINCKVNVWFPKQTLSLKNIESKTLGRGQYFSRYLFNKNSKILTKMAGMDTEPNNDIKLHDTLPSKKKKIKKDIIN